jgi:putative transposase
MPTCQPITTLLAMHTKSTEKFESQRLRHGRWSESGQIYLLTTTTLGRTPHFAEFEFACAAACALTSRQIWRGNALLAWVLMPDHWHGLVQLADHQHLSVAMQKFKGVTSRLANQKVNRSGPIWQPGYHDHALRHDEDIVDAARYIVTNPVRAGLVTQVRDYPFWDAAWL